MRADAGWGAAAPILHIRAAGTREPLNRPLSGRIPGNLLEMQELSRFCNPERIDRAMISAYVSGNPRRRPPAPAHPV